MWALFLKFHLHHDFSLLECRDQILKLQQNSSELMECWVQLFGTWKKRKWRFISFAVFLANKSLLAFMLWKMVQVHILHFVDNLNRCFQGPKFYIKKLSSQSFDLFMNTKWADQFNFVVTIFNGHLLTCWYHHVVALRNNRNWTHSILQKRRSLIKHYCFCFMLLSIRILLHFLFFKKYQ